MATIPNSACGNPEGETVKRRRPYGTGSLYLQGRRWYIQYYSNGKMFQESSRSTAKRVAEELLKQRLAQIRTGRFRGVRQDRITFEELAADLLADYRLKRRRSLRDAEARLRLHLRPFFGHLRAVDVTTDSIHRYIEKRRGEGAADGTVEQELCLLKRMFNLGRQTTPRKVAETPYIPLPGQDNVRTGFIEHEQYGRLRDALPDYLRPVFVMAYHTGMRKEEILSLRWEQVDLLGHRVRLEGKDTKSGEGRIIPLARELHETLILQRQRRDTECPDCPYVFFRMGRRIGDFRCAWHRACREAGVPRLLFHDLRRTGVRNLVRAGVPERVAMAISGHRTRSVFDRYNIVSERDVAEAAEKLEAYLAEKRTRGSALPAVDSELPASAGALTQ